MVAGVTAIDSGLATVTAAVPASGDADAAVTVAVPRAWAVASAPGVIEATPSFEELHVTLSVMSPVVPSGYLPVARSCWLNPREKARSGCEPGTRCAVDGVTVTAVTTRSVNVCVAGAPIPL